MSSLQENLSVLSRCITYRNLTAASKHVGLSQPQLSRIVKSLEEELNVILLDRSSPRHSSWTAQAKGVAEIYLKTERSLEAGLVSYLEESFQKEVHIGCLEGLADYALHVSESLLRNSPVQSVVLDVFDLNHIEAKFMSADLDIIFSSSTPGRKKYSYTKNIGYQTLDSHQKTRSIPVSILSSYENSKMLGKQKKIEKSLISSSLYIRRKFYDDFGGSVQLPSTVTTAKNVKQLKSTVPVLLIGQDHLNLSLWKQALKALKNKKLG